MFNSKRLRNATVGGLLVLFVLATGLQAESSANPAGDQLLKMILAKSLFCIRVNHFEYTLSQIDQFLAGVSPMPMGISILARSQFAKVLGSPQLNGVNMNGSFAVFGVTSAGKPPGPKPSDIFIGALVPTTDYKQFIDGNPNLSPPDEKGVSKITSNGTPIMLVTQVGNYALISRANDYDKLVVMAKSISASKAAGLASVLDAAEAKLAMTEPIWAYGNVQQASRTFGPLVFDKIEEVKTQMKSIEPNRPGAPPRNIQTLAENMINMYVSIFETLMKETSSVSLAIRPKPSACNLKVSVSAVPGTDMANMFVADASAAQENKLLGYLEDGAIMNVGFKANTPFLKKFNEKRFDLLAVIAGESITAEDTAKLKILAADMVDSLGGLAAFSFSIDAKNKPPFAIKYVIEVKDADKFDKVIKESIEMMNTSGIMDFYKSFGLEMSFAIKRGIERYKGVSIDSAKLVMKSTDPNSPQGQMMNAMFGAMFGDGIDYRWGIANGLWVCAASKEADLEIHKLIDQVKADGPKQMSDEMRKALTLLPEANKADFVATYNFLRWFKIVGAIMPMPMPMLQMDIPTKSNIVFAGKAGNGKMVVDIALPKEHLTEIVAAFQMMQQQQQKEAMAKAPEQDKRALSLNNLKQIALACLLYADEHDGKFAPDLQKLYPYHRNPKILESPLKPKRFDGPSYIYVAGLNRTIQEPWKIIIAYENPAFCSDRICVAFLDGHSESMRPEEFLKRLRATYKQLGREMPEIKFKGSQSRGIESISPEETIWVKCQNPDCKAAYQMGKRAYFKYIEEHADPMSPSAPALVCKKCGKESIYRAEKCEKCGLIFLRGTVPNDFADRCPKCGRSETEEQRKRRREAGLRR